MMLRYAKRMLAETDGRLLRKFIVNFGFGGMRAVGRFQRRLKRGETYPAFLFISVTNNCNLSCQGCWITPTSPVHELDFDTLNKVVAESKKQGSYFFGILGGEPLLHQHLFRLFEKHRDCYFLLFTNGTLITQETAERMRRLGNISPLISIEGKEIVSDQRRGGRNVYARALQGLEHCTNNRLITGVATSVCKSNIRELATESFVNELIQRGVLYLWYYIYRPVGPDPSPELALSQEEILDLRRFIVEERRKHPLLIVDSYWDHDGRALCPAAVGIAHHIGPNGDIEPCPPIQFARENIQNGKTLAELFQDSSFLKTFKESACASTRGCILMERPDLLYDTVQSERAWDTSGRGTALKELAAITPCPSHHHPDVEIPETFWPYRFAKKYWFFGFGAYG